MTREQMFIQNMNWSWEKSRLALSESQFNNIPDEILFHIFQYFPMRDLCAVSLVCRYFKMIADHDQIWKPICNTKIKLYSKSYRQIYSEWTYEKFLRKKKLLEKENNCKRKSGGMIYLPSLYPLRPANNYQIESFGGFNQHPNSKQDMIIHFSVDMDKTTSEFIVLLEKISSFQQLWQQSSILKQMIERYDRFMQLKASNPSNLLLIPTLDIEIIWQSHLLRPLMYRDDCIRLFGRIIDHSLILQSDIEQFFKEQAFLDTCQLYQQTFGDQYCILPLTRETNDTIYSYWDKTFYEFSVNPSNDYKNPFSFSENDIRQDGKWIDLCKQFMSNAIDRLVIHQRYFHFLTRIDLGEGPLKRLRKSYERFLYMAAKYPSKYHNKFLYPTYAIDLIWRLHLQEPLNYETDCLRLLGYILDHEPQSITINEKINTLTNQMWIDEFQCNIDMDHLYNTSDNKDKWFG